MIPNGTGARAILASPCALLALVLLPGIAAALDVPRGAVRTFENVASPSSYALPTAPWHEATGLPFRQVEGAVRREAWRIDGTRLTPLQMLRPLRQQIEAQGYEILLDCADRTCGGFDFRFGTEVIAAPDMFVNLTAYHFVSARHPEGGAISLLASSTDSAAWLQIITVAPSAPPPSTAHGTPARRFDSGSGAEGQVMQSLLTEGHFVLSDLDFASGSAGLGDGSIASLDALADYLRDHPGAEIAFVGHTDTTGSLAVNRALSQRRAQAAVDYLRSRHGISGTQISAQGVGYLAPRTGNLSEAGREANRRVEAVLVRPE